MTEQLNEYVNFVDTLKTEYKDLFEHLIDSGIGNNRAIEMIKALPDQEQKYLDNVKSIEVQLSFELDWLNEHCNWEELSVKEKNLTLWQLGLNTKTKNYAQEERRVRKGNTTVFKAVVYGEERMDKEWVGKTYHDPSGTNHYYYASDAVRDYLWQKKQRGG